MLILKLKVVKQYVISTVQCSTTKETGSWNGNLLSFSFDCIAYHNMTVLPDGHIAYHSMTTLPESMELKPILKHARGLSSVLQTATR